MQVRSSKELLVNEKRVDKSRRLSKKSGFLVFIFLGVRISGEKLRNYLIYFFDCDIM